MSFEFNQNNIESFLINQYKTKKSIIINEYKDFLINEIHDSLKNNKNFDEISINKKVTDFIPTSIYDTVIKRIDIFNINDKIILSGIINNNSGGYNNILNDGKFIINGKIINNNTNLEISDLKINGYIRGNRVNKLFLSDVLCSEVINITGNTVSENEVLDYYIDNLYAKDIKLSRVYGNKNLDYNRINIYYNKSNLNINRINSINIENIKNIDEMYFNFPSKIKYMKNFSIKKFITKNSNESKYTINGLNTDNLILEDIHNNSNNLVFTNCYFGKLTINNSNLGKAVFNGVTIKQLEIHNTTLNDCIFNGVDFQNYTLGNESRMSLKIMKDNYRQLKHVMDKNGNHTEANKFFALEMEYYSKLENISWYEKISLGIQKFVNGYGNNWFKNFIIILLFAGLCTLINYFYLLMFYDLIKFDFILTFFNLLSPFYGLGKDTFNTLNLDLPLYGSFILYKIIYGTLIYQFIIALKRSTKR